MIHLMGFEEAPTTVCGKPVLNCLAYDAISDSIVFHKCRPAWFVPGYICVSCGKRSGFSGCLEPQA